MPSGSSVAQRVAGAVPADLTDRLRKLRDLLLTGLVERDVAIRLALIAALSGEHLLLLGPPGTAKSLVASRLRAVLRDATYFERLLTRFTVPEELFGPLSIKGLEDDRYQRLTERYLPTASIAFLDEIFKANSAILNALLTLLNEREFDNGTERVRTPLLTVVGASNELPDMKELGALFDRFLLRLHVGPVSKEGFADLLALRGDVVPATSEAMKLTGTDLSEVQSAAASVEVPADVVSMLSDLREWCAAEKVAVSDRRWRKVVKLLQVSALTNGNDRVSIWDCWLLQYCIGDDEPHRAKVCEWYAARLGASAAMDPAKLTKAAVSWEGALKRDQESRTQVRDEQGRPVFLDRMGKQTPDSRGPVRKRRNGEDLYLAPPEAARRDPQYRSSYERLHRRDNDGNGYTLAELDDRIVSPYDHEDFKRWRERSEYLANPNNWMTEEGDLAPHVEPTRHRAVYVAGCKRDLAAIYGRVVAYQQRLSTHARSLKAEVDRHLWVLSSFSKPAMESLERTQTEVASLRVRVERLQAGYESLPKERDDATPTFDDEVGD